MPLSITPADFDAASGFADASRWLASLSIIFLDDVASFSRAGSRRYFIELHVRAPRYHFRLRFDFRVM